MSPVGGFLAALLAATALADAPSHSSYVQRLRFLAQLQTLNAELLSQDSATAVLQAMCERRAPGEHIRARKLDAPENLQVAAAARRQLGAAPGEPIRRRWVELTCGDIVLSRAENWYLPGRLTQQMNTQLESSETPFGVVVRPLGFLRRTLSARLLFDPLPAGWETRPPASLDTPLTPPEYVLQHRAVLQTLDGRPFSLLAETYTSAVLVP